MDHWYVARTHVGAEKMALEHLERQGFLIYLPVLLEERPGRRGAGAVATPLFPGYVFVHFDMDLQRWQAVNGTQGVVRLLPQHREFPEALPDGLVDVLRARSAAGEFTRGVAREVLLGYLPGDPVPIIDGTFQGMTGTFRKQRDGVVSVFLSLLGRAVEVKLPQQVVAYR